jgi:hypothetical protein
MPLALFETSVHSKTNDRIRVNIDSTIFTFKVVPPLDVWVRASTGE